MLSQMVKNIVIADGHTHFFLIQSTTEGHLGCFQFWVIISKADISNLYIALYKEPPFLLP